MKIVSLAIVIIFGGLLLVHYYRQYYNYTNHIKSTSWPCETDELGNCVKEIELNKCPDYWQQSTDGNSAVTCSNVHKICPANNPNCRNKKTPFVDQDTSVTLPQIDSLQQCQYSHDTKYSWDGACARARSEQK